MLDVPDSDLKQKLIELGLDPTYASGIGIAQAEKAQRGDTEAARFVRDTIGEGPKQALEIGNLDDKPFESLDLSQLTDDQLRALAARRMTKNDTD
jgi:hypothetical protein